MCVRVFIQLWMNASAGRLSVCIVSGVPGGYIQAGRVLVIDLFAYILLLTPLLFQGATTTWLVDSTATHAHTRTRAHSLTKQVSERRGACVCQSLKPSGNIK